MTNTTDAPVAISNIETYGWEAALRGMRNPLNSWARADSEFEPEIKIGPNDYDLMKRLWLSGNDHRKYLRMINVAMDISMPLYWWKEFDTYKIGTVANSCSTMHKIQAKEFTINDFACGHLYGESFIHLKGTLDILNKYREKFLETKKKSDWWQMIQLLPSSYIQKRTVVLNYEVLANMYKSRKDHKLDEWHCFCSMIEKCLPYPEFITGEFGEFKTRD